MELLDPEGVEIGRVTVQGPVLQHPPKPLVRRVLGKQVCARCKRQSFRELNFFQISGRQAREEHQALSTVDSDAPTVLSSCSIVPRKKEFFFFSYTYICAWLCVCISLMGLLSVSILFFEAGSFIDLGAH